MNIQRDLPVTHIVIGTKAQFIKMAPIARLLQESSWPYRLLDLGQHGSITPGIVRDFGLSAEHIYVLPAGATVSTYSQAFHWVLTAVTRFASPRRKLVTKFVRHPPGYALVHGDTLSTLIGLHLAKRLRLNVGLVEAGLSSGRRFDPFPEELIRRHVEKRADVLFAPDRSCANRLKRRGLKGKIVNTIYNTGRDALLCIAQQHASSQIAGESFRTVLTLHRAETITRQARLCAVVEHVIRLAPHIGPIRFFLHEPTRRALIRANLIHKLQDSPNFQLCPLESYPLFTAALVQATYILTDGGSIQEEASYLNKPCLILRRTTERAHGLGETAMLASMNADLDLEFLRNEWFGSPDALTGLQAFEASRTILRSLYAHNFDPVHDVQVFSNVGLD